MELNVNGDAKTTDLGSLIESSSNRAAELLDGKVRDSSNRGNNHSLIVENKDLNAEEALNCRLQPPWRAGKQQLQHREGGCQSDRSCLSRKTKKFTKSNKKSELTSELSWRDAGTAAGRSERATGARRDAAQCQLQRRLKG